MTMRLKHPRTQKKFQLEKMVPVICIFLQAEIAPFLVPCYLKMIGHSSSQTFDFKKNIYHSSTQYKTKTKESASHSFQKVRSHSLVLHSFLHSGIALLLFSCGHLSPTTTVSQRLKKKKKT